MQEPFHRSGQFFVAPVLLFDNKGYKSGKLIPKRTPVEGEGITAQYDHPDWDPDFEWRIRLHLDNSRDGEETLLRIRVLTCSDATKSEDRIRLSELLAANKKLATVYVLKDDLKHLWNYWHTGYARSSWKQWYNRAMRSGIAPLKAFARKLNGYLPGILAHCRWRLHTSLLEGNNNKIKVIKRMAYGFRDDDYFFLKIRQAFHGNGP